MHGAGIPHRIFKNALPLVILRGRFFFLAPKNPRDASGCEKARYNVAPIAVILREQCFLLRRGDSSGPKNGPSE